MGFLSTPHLDLLTATPEMLEAELSAPAELGRQLAARVPPGWPPGEYDAPAIGFFRDTLVTHPEEADWLVWYALLREPTRTLIGAGGFIGPPDADGSVEIGYSILPAFAGHGYATEMTRALVDFAFSAPRVTRITAHLERPNPASARVLEKCGFSPPVTPALPWIRLRLVP